MEIKKIHKGLYKTDNDIFIGWTYDWNLKTVKWSVFKSNCIPLFRCGTKKDCIYWLKNYFESNKQTF